VVSHVTTLTGRALNRQGDAFVSFVEMAGRGTHVNEDKWRDPKDLH
jgi:hypothetical protein